MLIKNCKTNQIDDKDEEDFFLETKLKLLLQREQWGRVLKVMLFKLTIDSYETKSL